MAAVSGTRSDISGKPQAYQSQTMSVTRSSATRESSGSNSTAFLKNRTSVREKTSSVGHHLSPPKTFGATDNQNSIKPPPDGSRPLPNGPGPLNARGEKVVAVEVLQQNTRNTSIPRQSRKDGNSSIKSTGSISIHNNAQGYSKGSSDHDRLSSDKLSVAGYRPPRSSSSVNISASTRAVALSDASSLVAYPRPVDDLKLSHRNMNSSNDNLEQLASSSSGERRRMRTRDVLPSSTAPKQFPAEKSFDQADYGSNSHPPMKSRLQQQQQLLDGADHGVTGKEHVDGASGSKLSTGSESKHRSNGGSTEAAAAFTAKVQNLDLGRQLDSSVGLSGLQNLGNTCFMNSILQCLSNTQPLLEFCLGGDYTSQINAQTSSLRGAMIKAYVRLTEEMWRPGGSSHSIGAIAPTDFKFYISKYSRHFVGTREHDAHEFLVYLLEGLHEDLNRVREKKKRFIDSSDQVETISATDKAILSWERYVECDNSAIIDIFMGQLRSALTCKKCGYVSNTFEPFLALSLPIKQAGSQVSLSDCFKLFSHEETLDGDNKPKCAKCRTRNACTKQMSIQKFPQVLIIHLMRFKQGTTSKLNTQVSCPLSGLDLSSFTTVSNCSTAVYNLYAVSNHSGTPLTGHYTAYAKHPYSNQWHLFNDSRVTSISLTTVNSSEAYLLFYELQDRGVLSS